MRRRLATAALDLGSARRRRAADCSVRRSPARRPPDVRQRVAVRGARCSWEARARRRSFRRAPAHAHCLLVASEPRLMLLGLSDDDGEFLPLLLECRLELSDLPLDRSAARLELALPPGGLLAPRQRRGPLARRLRHPAPTRSAHRLVRSRSRSAACPRQSAHTRGSGWSGPCRVISGHRGHGCARHRPQCCAAKSRCPSARTDCVQPGQVDYPPAAIRLVKTAVMPLALSRSTIRSSVACTSTSGPRKAVIGSMTTASGANRSMSRCMRARCISRP